MKILRVSFLGVRGVRDATFDLTDPATGEPHDVVLVTGAAAAGKTRFLEAIVAAKESIAPYGPVAGGDAWIAAGEVAKMELLFHLDEEERTYAGQSSALAEADVRFFAGRTESLASEGLRAVLERFVQGAGAGKVEYFPASRRIAAHPPFADLAAATQRALRPSKAAHKYSFVARFLRELAPSTDRQRSESAARTSSDRARAFAERLAALSPTCRYEPDDGTGRCLRSRGRSPVTVAEISDSEADAVLFAATAMAIDLQCSLVLVDRPDLHAHPEDARRIVAGLRALGVDNQLFLTSGSPRFAAAAEAEGALVVRLEAR